jgi:hypothetical protein
MSATRPLSRSFIVHVDCENRAFLKTGHPRANGFCHFTIFIVGGASVFIVFEEFAGNRPAVKLSIQYVHEVHHAKSTCGTNSTFFYRLMPAQSRKTAFALLKIKYYSFSFSKTS